MQVLKGHTSAATAYIVNDYPYGFRLRCKIRYWLETTDRGTRFCSQTTNPKKPTKVWNTPKRSTYVEVGCMYLHTGSAHVVWTGIGAYSSQENIIAFRDSFRDGLTEADLKKIEVILNAHEVYAVLLKAHKV
jgi:hypothetical protein